MAFSLGSTLGYAFGRERNSASSTQTTRKNVSQEGIDKIMRDILGSEQGLAALATGENLSGGTASTSKTQLAQNLVTDLAGQLALINAETITTTNSQSKTLTDKLSESTTGQVGTVICTELVRQGLLPKELYDAGHPHFLSLPRRTIIGYQLWAKKVVPIMQKSERLSKALLPIAFARYNHITNRNRNVIGWLTVWAAQPVCYVIGYIVEVLYATRLLQHT